MSCLPGPLVDKLLNVLLCPPEKSAHYPNPLKPDKICTEHSNTLLQQKTKPSCLSAVKDPTKNNSVIRDPLHIPDTFNEHFASVGDNLASRLPSMQHSYVDFLAKSKSPQSSFYFRPVTASEVETEILSIPMIRKHGLYSCPTLLLKYVSDIMIISLPLATLLNVCVCQGVYPPNLELSKIVPVFKSGDELDANNYRPTNITFIQF